MQYLIGIDIGTTHTKAVVATESARIITEIKKTYSIDAVTAFYHEQDSEDVFQTVLSALKEAIDSISDKENIACVCFSAAMHSIMAIDVNGHPITNLYTWADIRSHQQAKELKSSSRAKSLYNNTGVPVHAMSPLCKISWIRQNLPHVFTAAHKFISGKEYIFYRLFNQFVVDYSIASATGLFDLDKVQWNGDALKEAGITADKLSALVPVTHALLDLQPEYLALLGLSQQIAFVIGSSDGVMANLGSGAILPGEAALTIGTSGALRSIVKGRKPDSQQRLFNYFIDGKNFLAGGATNNGGIVMKWFYEVFTDRTRSFEESVNALAHEASFIPAGSEGLIFLPYLYGERAPVWDAEAKGIFYGIRSVHSKAHFFRATLEGVAFSLLQILNALEETTGPVQKLYASGGFIESSLWLRIVADVLQKKMVVSHAADASALGAIFVGMRYLGLIDDLTTIKNFVREDETIDPDQGQQGLYKENFAIFSELYSKLS